MKKLTVLASLLVLASSGCASMRAGLASASAPHIQGCSAEEIEASNTYGANPFSGPSWKATCHGRVYECSGYYQVASTVKCHPLAN